MIVGGPMTSTLVSRRKKLGFYFIYMIQKENLGFSAIAEYGKYDETQLCFLWLQIRSQWLVTENRFTNDYLVNEKQFY